MRLLIPMLVASLISGCAGAERTSRTVPGAVRADDTPKTAEEHISRARDCYARAQYDQAINELDEAIRLEPRNAGAFSGRGCIWFAKKENDRAINDLNESIRLEPEKPSSGYYIRGVAWYMKKEYAKGVKDLDIAIHLNADDAEALNSRAWAAATCPDQTFRDQEKAIAFARRACELNGWKNVFYLGTFAAACAENADFENAVKWQRKALEDDAYKKECGEEGRKMLKLYEQRKPYREEAGSGK